jgi:MFS family permease
MATNTEARVVYAAGVVQGITLVTFPAASAIFTDPSDYGLSRSEYGAMFLPQALMAITFALLGAGLARRMGVRRLYLWGLAANLVAMALLLASSLFESEPAAYPTLLVATASLGIGFGLTVPAINTLTAAFHPTRVDSSVLVLNALLGLGTALAPVLVAVFVGLGFWWGLPLLSGILLVVLLGVSLRLPLVTGDATGAPAS